jgi:hypothetical protein
VTGAKREVDVVVSGHVASQLATVSIECRDRNRSPDVTWVDEMHGKHSRLPTNLLVLVSHRSFTPEALRTARLYDIRCHVLDDVQEDAPNRLFPDAKSLWGKGWSLTIDRVNVEVEALGSLPPERILASPDNRVFLEDGTELGPMLELAVTLLRSQPIIDKMIADAKPEHSFLELVWQHPVAQGCRVCLQKSQPLLLRPIARLRMIARCTVTIDEFPLRHGKLEGLRIAWGTGAILGNPAMVIATASSGESPKITLLTENTVSKQES